MSRRIMWGVAITLAGCGWARLASAQPSAEAVIGQVASKVDQLDQQLPDFDRIRTPDSPAFSILGVSPTEIQKPSTPAALAAGVGGFLSGGSPVIPRSLSLEVAPYWLVSHPGLTAEAFERGGWRNAYRTLTFSIGTKQTERRTVAAGAIVAQTDSNLGLGVRMRLYASTPDQGRACLKLVQQAAQEVSAAYLVPQAALQRARADSGGDDALFATKIAELQRRYADEQKRALQMLELARNTALKQRCFDITASTQGISADLAGAIDTFFAEGKTTASARDLHAGAVWFTIAYSNESFTGAFLGRYHQRKLTPDWQRVLDAGARLVYKRKSFALSGEGVLRGRLSGPDQNNRYKVDLTAEYEIRDQLWLTITFGKDFAGAQAGALLSLANLSWGFGMPSVAE